MVLLHAKPSKLAVMKGQLPASGVFTHVLGGTLSASTFDDGASGFISWDKFVGTPSVFVTVLSGGGQAYYVGMSGVTACGGYLYMYKSGIGTASGADVNLMIVGEQNL